MILCMFRASHAHLQEDIVYLQNLVSSRSVCCHTLHRLRADCSPLLIGATHGSIQSVRISDTANIQCPPEDEHGMLETCRGSLCDIITE
jgi:hypothetical protein